MDAHYDMVMKARAEAGNDVRWYFAYSTILDRSAFLEWRDQHSYSFFDLPAGEIAEAVDLSLVFDFPSRWWGGRVAGLQDTPGQSIFGRLFPIQGKDWPIIQHKEGAVTGMCVEREVTVIVQGEKRQATAFTTNPARASLDGPISNRFIEALVRGAQSANLPHSYISTLSSEG